MSTVLAKRFKRKNRSYVLFYTHIPQELAERVGLIPGAKLKHHLVVPYNDGKPILGARPTKWQTWIDLDSVNVCSNCKTINTRQASYCTNCGMVAPQKGLAEKASVPAQSAGAKGERVEGQEEKATAPL
jgi:hypothetical protein